MNEYCNNCNGQVVEEGEEIKDNVMISMTPNNINRYCVECLVMIIGFLGKLNEKEIKEK